MPVTIVTTMAALSVAAFSQQAQEVADREVKAALRKAAEESQEAGERAKPWVEAALQIDSVEKRQAAVEEIRAALRSSDSKQQRVGLAALKQIGAVNFDKASFRDAVRPLLDSPDAAIRAAACSALVITGCEPADLDRVLALADDPSPEVRMKLSWIIKRLNGGDLTGKASDAVVKLLASPSRLLRKEALRGLWGGKFAPELEKRVLELSQDISGFGEGYDAFYFALSTQANKSEATIARLIQILADPDPVNKAGRALWGLGHGVPEEHAPKVAEAMLKLFEARSDPGLRRECLRLLARYATAAHLPALQSIAAKPGLDGDLKKQVEATITAVRARR